MGPRDLSEFRTEVFVIFALLAVGVKKKKSRNFLNTRRTLPLCIPYTLIIVLSFPTTRKWLRATVRLCAIGLLAEKVRLRFVAKSGQGRNLTKLKCSRLSLTPWDSCPNPGCGYSSKSTREFELHSKECRLR